MIKPMMPPPEPTTAFLRLSIMLSGLAGAAGVAGLALASHAFAGNGGQLITAAQMLMLHAPILLAIGLLAQLRRVMLLPLTCILLTAGLGLFSGDLYLKTFLGDGLFPMAAPTGGMLLIAGWFFLVLGAFGVTPRHE